MIGDRRSLEDHFLRPKERLVEYDQALRDLIMCAQKEYLHGVGVTRVWSMEYGLCSMGYAVWNFGVLGVRSK